jgi:N-acyl-phosphatidylethanolamine-hydrolysing phospholipase D
MILRILLFPILFFLMASVDTARKVHHTDSGFENPWMTEEDKRNFSDFLRWQWDRHVVDRIDKPKSYDFDRVPEEYVNPPERVYGGMLTWVGHATFLVQMENVNILTDPVWSERVGPLNNRVGPTRYTPPGIPWEKLPPIDIVVISHNHYDHMDRPTIERLARDFDPVFLFRWRTGSFWRTGV